MFCSKCGKHIPDGASFCQGCGKPVNTVGLPQSMHQAEQPAGTAQPVTRAVVRPTAPLPAELPVKCPVCGMLAYPGQSRCLICDADLGTAVSPERGTGQEPQQASVSEQTSKQESETGSESEQSLV